MIRDWDEKNDDHEKEGSKTDLNAPGKKIEESLHRAEPLIEQVNNLYTMFVAGVERLPPHEKRKQLEALMEQIHTTPSPNTTYQFRVNTLYTRFVTMRDRWDKLVRDLESGKINRVTGPKRKKSGPGSAPSGS